jgi:probable F420-dependent oxidoreductase
MKLWLTLANQPIEDMVAWAREAEALGYEGITLPDHLVVNTGGVTPHPTGYQLQPETSFGDPMCVFSAMAALTTRLRFLTYVYLVPLRDVFALTKQITTLQLLSNNRFVLGTGVGWMREEFDTVGIDWTTRGKRFDEMLDIMRDFWDDGYAEYHGRFFDFPRAAMFPVPTQQPEIWIGGNTTVASTRAPRFDGFVPLDGVNERTRADFAAIDKVRAEQGLTTPFERVVLGPTDPQPEEIRRLADEQGITAIVMSPLIMWNPTMQPRTDAELHDATRRYAEIVLDA